jgi:GGDEF domain-containing protein
MGSAAIAHFGVAQGTVVTLATVMIIGLGFLHRPSRASLMWSLAFVLAMVSTWVSLAGEALGDEPLRRAGLGLMLGAPALIWSGFRARRRAPALPWVAPLQSALSAAALVVVGTADAYGLAFRVVFFGASIFAGLTLLEIRRSVDRDARLILPLVLVSAAFAVIGALALVSGLIFPSEAADDLAFVRTLNALGMLIYLVCATVSLLFLASVSPVGTHSAMSWPQFTVTATDRLTRARDAGEPSWALLAVRIDDPGEIRAAAGDAAFVRILERFERIVRAGFPAEADLGREGRGRMVVLISRPGPVLREHVRSVLRDITEMDPTEQIAVRLSASIGWASADIIGHDFRSLLASAQLACDEASRQGGDRWERVGA